MVLVPVYLTADRWWDCRLCLVHTGVPSTYPSKCSLNTESTCGYGKGEIHLKMLVEALKTFADGRRESHFKDRMSEGSGKGCPAGDTKGWGDWHKGKVALGKWGIRRGDTWESLAGTPKPSEKQKRHGNRWRTWLWEQRNLGQIKTRKAAFPSAG